MMAPQTPALTLAPPEGVIKAPERFFTANGVTYAADQLLVQFRRGLPDKVIDAILTRHGVTILTRNRDINWITVAVPSNKDVTTLVKELKALPEVEQAFLSGIGEAGSVPTDEYYTTPVGQYAPRITGMEAAWDRTRGNGNWSIAVLDSGIKSDHEDLVNKINGALGIPSDNDGHGTFVAGLAAAQTTFPPDGAGYGMAGTDPNTRILPIFINGDTNDIFMSEGIRRALTVPGVKVINISYQPRDLMPQTYTLIQEAIRRRVLVVAITGNNPDVPPYSFVYPGAYYNVMAVSATDESDRRAVTSTFQSNQQNFNSVAAPGLRVLSTIHNIAGLGSHNYGSGTSFAAPQVSGLATLLLAQYPSMTGLDLKYRIEDTAADVNAATLPGWDWDLGWGRINADAATLPQALYSQTFNQTGVYRLITVPAWVSYLTMDDANRYDDVNRLFPGAGAQVYWYDSDTQTNLAYWDARVPRFGPGRSYWVKFNSPTTATYTGAYPFEKGDHRVPVPLRIGANAIGTPARGGVLWNPYNVWVNAPDQNGATVGGNLDQARQWGWVPTGTLYRFNPATQDYDPVPDYSYMEPGEGYYLHSNIECTLLLPGS